MFLPEIDLEILKRKYRQESIYATLIRANEFLTNQRGGYFVIERDRAGLFCTLEGAWTITTRVAKLFVVEIGVKGGDRNRTDE